MRKDRPDTAPVRIATVWESNSLRAQRILSGLCRWADLKKGAVLGMFDALHPQFNHEVVPLIREWKPDGIVVHCGSPEHMQSLRKQLPDSPIVSTNAMQASLVDAVVAASTPEVVRLARDFFRSQGVMSIGLFAPGSSRVMSPLISLFHAEIPDAPVCGVALDTSLLCKIPSAGEFPLLEKCLLGLPRPTAIMTVETHGALFLARVCKLLRLQIPHDIQLIGVDDLDDCMGCEPHLSSINFPSERIGEVAFDTLLELVRGGSRPPPIIRVEGASIIPRGSTGPVPLPQRRVSAALELINSEAMRGVSAGTVVTRSKQGSINTFYKEFRAVTGSTPALILRRRRVEEACRMLRESTESITRISELCGFSSANYFAQVFRLEIGKTPMQYRRDSLPSVKSSLLLAD